MHHLLKQNIQTTFKEQILLQIIELNEQSIGCKNVTKWSTIDCQLFYSSTITIEQRLSSKKCMKLEIFV